MYRLLILTFFMIGCTKQEPAPQKWNDWVQSRTESFQKKISVPAAIQFLYLPKAVPSFYLSNGSRGFRLSTSRLESNDVAYKLNFQDESLRDTKNQSLGDKSAPIKVSERIYLRVVFMQAENKARVFLYDLEKKDLAKKRKRHFFSYSKKSKHTATYSKLPQIKTARFQRSDGTTRDFKIMGNLKIANGSTFSVYAEADQTDKLVMLMFRDMTNGESTYGAGRYLYVELPTAPKDLREGQYIDLDFNYTFNPPCAVSKGYHCPFPQDLAIFKIEAGEKYL